MCNSPKHKKWNFSGFTSDQQPRNIMFNSAYFRIVVDL